jgi:hypothetical protein
MSIGDPNTAATSIVINSELADLQPLNEHIESYMIWQVLAEVPKWRHLEGQPKFHR